MSPGDTPVEILVVCTANRCRSPLAAAMLTDALVRRGWAPTVTTAGLKRAGQPVTHNTATIATRYGLDLTGHRSSTLAPEALDAADLVLGMERVHVREVVALERRTWPRTFTLKGLVRRAETAGPRRADEPFADWLARMGEGRMPADLLGDDPEDTVTDPTGGTLAEHGDLAEELQDLVTRLADLVTPQAGPPPIHWQI